jgi:ABC-2 type transport system permease protein
MKLARDTWLTFQYETVLLIRNPASIAITLIQPLTYLVLFTPFLKGVMGVSSYGDAYQVYVPSLFAAMGIYSGLYAGFALLAAMHQGVISRCRVTPVSRIGLLLGRELMYVLLIGFQAVIVTLAALALGLRVRPANLLFSLVLLSMMVLLGVSISYCLAMLVPNETTLPTITNSIAQPVALLAGVLIPLSVAPLWVRHVALWNPFAWGTRGMRAILEGQLSGSLVWQASLIMTALAALAVLLTSRMFSREVA